MKPSPLHSLLFFMPDELSNSTIYRIVIGILCILLAFSLVALYRRIKYGTSFTEGMANPSAAPSTLDPDVVAIKSQTVALQSIYDKLQNGITDQKNRIDGNTQTLMKTLSDSPSQTNNLTHANVDQTDPSKTKIPNISMS